MSQVDVRMCNNCGVLAQRHYKHEGWICMTNLCMMISQDGITHPYHFDNGGLNANSFQNVHYDFCSRHCFADYINKAEKQVKESKTNG